jgi:hypothetical protein
MAFREVPVYEIREVLRLRLGGEGYRSIARLTGVDRKTVRRYVEAAEAAGVVRDGGVEQLTDAVLGVVCGVVRPARPGGHGAAWESLVPHEELIRGWVKQDLRITKMVELLARRRVAVPYRTLHRFAVERCGFSPGRGVTVRVADGEPGGECQVDFGRMGLIFDPVAGRRRVVWALIFTAVFSRHSFVWLSFQQRLVDVIEGSRPPGCSSAGCSRWSSRTTSRRSCSPPMTSIRGSTRGSSSTPSPAGLSWTRPGSAIRPTSRGWSGRCLMCATRSSPVRSSPIWIGFAAVP